MFLVVNVDNKILGADFLSNFPLLVYMQGERLVQLAQPAKQFSVTTMQKVPQSSNPFIQLLNKFACLTTPDNCNSTASHKVDHYFETTGHPVGCISHRLDQLTLKIAKSIFRTHVTVRHNPPNHFCKIPAER